MVYLVVNDCIDNFYIIAIYKSKEKAEKRAKRENKKQYGGFVKVEKWKLID